MLTSKEKAYLKALANPLNPIFQVGKEGISYNQLVSIGDALEAHELIKISVLKTCSNLVREVALDLAAPLKAEIVQTIGRVIILYRKSKKNVINLKEAVK